MLLGSWQQSIAVSKPYCSRTHWNAEVGRSQSHWLSMEKNPSGNPQKTSWNRLVMVCTSWVKSFPSFTKVPAPSIVPCPLKSILYIIPSGSEPTCQVRRLRLEMFETAGFRLQACFYIKQRVFRVINGPGHLCSCDCNCKNILLDVAARQRSESSSFEHFQSEPSDLTRWFAVRWYI